MDIKTCYRCRKSQGLISALKGEFLPPGWLMARLINKDEIQLLTSRESWVRNVNTKIVLCPGCWDAIQREKKQAYEARLAQRAYEHQQLMARADVQASLREGPKNANAAQAFQWLASRQGRWVAVSHTRPGTYSSMDHSGSGILPAPDISEFGLNQVQWQVGDINFSLSLKYPYISNDIQIQPDWMEYRLGYYDPQDGEGLIQSPTLERATEFEVWAFRLLEKAE